MRYPFELPEDVLIIVRLQIDSLGDCSVHSVRGRRGTTSGGESRVV